MKIWYIRKCQDATKTVLEFIDLNTYMRKEEPGFQLEFKKKWAELQECWKIEYKKGKSQWQEKSNWKNKSKSSLVILIKLTTLLNWEERQEGEERVYVWEEERAWREEWRLRDRNANYQLPTTGKRVSTEDISWTFWIRKYIEKT